MIRGFESTARRPELFNRAVNLSPRSKAHFAMFLRPVPGEHKLRAHSRAKSRAAGRSPGSSVCSPSPGHATRGDRAGRPAHFNGAAHAPRGPRARVRAPPRKSAGPPARGGGFLRGRRLATRPGHVSMLMRG